MHSDSNYLGNFLADSKKVSISFLEPVLHPKPFVKIFSTGIPAIAIAKPRKINLDLFLEYQNLFSTLFCKIEQYGCIR